VLFRDAEALETLRKIDTLIVDKTGTLTLGRPVFASAVGVAPFTEDEVLRIAASIDQGSEHPLANAIVEAARGRGLQLAKPEAFESATGIGVRGKLEGRSVVLGNTALLRETGGDRHRWRRGRAAARRSACSWLSIRLLQDCSRCTIRSRSPPGCDRGLHRAGIRIIMATGDGPTTAQVPAPTGIEAYGRCGRRQGRPVVRRNQRKRAAAAAGRSTTRRHRARTSASPWAVGPMYMSSAGTLVKGDLRGIACAAARGHQRNIPERLRG
jgi:Cu+-exporting ATPase